MKKILLIADSLSGRGGMEKVLKTFYHQFNQYEEFSVKLILLNSSKDTTWLNNVNFSVFDISEIVKERRKKNALLRIFLQGKIKKNYKDNITEKTLAEMITQDKPDLIISTGYSYLNILNRIRNNIKLNYKIIFWDHMSHSYYLSDNKEFLTNIKAVDYFFAISSGIKKSLINLGVSEDKIALIYNPIKERELNKFNIERMKFIYVGRLFSYDQKRCMDIIHAIKKIESLNFVFEFYGDGQDKDKLVLECNKLGLDHKVIFRGWFDQPWDHIEDASCLILASQYEGLPLVLAEAISYGIPCISSNCKFGPEDIIIPKVNGDLFEVGNVDQLANMMKNYISNSLNFRSEKEIKHSISNLYEEKYFENLKRVIDHL